MGTLFRLLIIAAIIWFIYSLILRAIAPPQAQTPLPPAPLMHQCAQCGVHIPEGESTQSQGRFFAAKLIVTFIYNKNHDDLKKRVP